MDLGRVSEQTGLTVVFRDPALSDKSHYSKDRVTVCRELGWQAKPNFHEFFVFLYIKNVLGYKFKIWHKVAEYIALYEKMK